MSRGSDGDHVKKDVILAYFLNQCEKKCLHRYKYENYTYWFLTFTVSLQTRYGSVVTVKQSNC